MCLLFLPFLSRVYLQGQELRMLWYNTENFFHPADDSLPGDEEFTPEGDRRWTLYRYREKCTRMAKVILAAGVWGPPGAAGLCEIEHAGVLEDLIAHPLLEPWNFSYIHHESPDHRGMDVAFIFRREVFNLLGHEYFTSPGDSVSRATREMLHLWANLPGRKDTLDFFLVHLISRYRGSATSAVIRRKQSDRLADLVDSVAMTRSRPVIILAGDFNAEAGDWSLEPLVGLKMDNYSLKLLQTGPRKSYKYRSIWEEIDAFMVLSVKQRLNCKASVLWLPALLEKDDLYGGLRPFRTYRGFDYKGGYSDHLPLLLELNLPYFPNSPGR